ncbi:nuclear transport factor 2 family protein [Herbiconiux moechotypicola]|uniref:SnoaL-like domain-containing protein n=1 Tax=Herbiconiux moechotypicola TaxID=637393 RepID=A0ABN3E3L7_9MICO|nr:nuclear transport factor 2 family protein [Herbiconiux moechotypicola]MCS5731525.1 nuclear transport factor 2 family protein [Herbiconiux moechotypicola]
MSDDATRLASWIDGYRAAWLSNDPDQIRALFTEEGVYHPGPSGESWQGHDEIVAGWLDARDEPGDTEFSWEPVVATAEVGVAQCVSTYRSGAVYDNLWVIRFAPDGRATSYTDWWIQREES